jgi:hypothetical protein
MPEEIHDGPEAAGPGAPEAPTSPAPRPRRDAAVAAGLAAVLLVAYSANGEVLPGNDATASVRTAVTLLQERRMAFTPSSDPDLFEWKVMDRDRVLATIGFWDLDVPVDGPRTARQLWAAGVLVPHAPYYLAPTVRTSATGEPLFVSTFGPGTPIAALPALAAVRGFAGDLRATAATWFGAKAAASLFVALAGALVFLAARALGAGPAAAALVALAFGLGTGVFSTSSQTLWQHAPNTLFLALGACALVRPGDGARSAAVAGAAFALATSCRPTSAVFAVAGAVLLLVRDRRAFAAYAAAAAPVALAIAAYNTYWFGSPFLFGQTVVGPGLARALTGVADQWQTPLSVGVPGLLVSPSRGLFVFSPFLLAAVPGAVLAFRRRELAPLRALALAAAVTVLLAARHYDWWGGWSYGYRHVVDLAPALALLVVPTLGWISRAAWRRAAFGVLVLWSVAVQVVGVLAYDLSGWNAPTAYHVRLASGEAVKVPEEEARALVERGAGAVTGQEAMEVAQPPWRHRLWSLRDNQILYYLRHFGEARARRRAMSASWVEPPRPAGAPGSSP